MGPSHDRKQKRRHRGMFFCLLETLTPALPRQIGTARSQMRFLLPAQGVEKRSPITTILHDSELSHLCSPTFTLISFRGPGAGVGAGECRGVRTHVCAHVRLICTLSTHFLFLALYPQSKIKTPSLLHKKCLLFFFFYL